ncbi:hypothetical protein BN14_09292 [Rhizoctonia solani AG-1 IB]|uniref:G domain-containing protein n=1 Tax=Thanatephorus cucumeris (strain AG1-IB / isolate 7/3/14) TaxID=1108050 RepID=M5CFY5_THACB|nr:hypothetical protein BN14_09292 [Rhizoctonia solani AG-1 IB]
MAANIKTYQATKEHVLSVLKLSNKKAITVALVGAVDSGKAAFVSLLLELFQGTEADDLIRDYSDERFNQPHSQTTDVTLHNITTLDGAVIQILDAPDFGTKDDRPSAEKKTRNSMQADIHSIDALLVVADGHSVQLASDTLDAITEIFPRTLVDNIGVVFANSDEDDWKFDMNSLPSELRSAQHWLLHNPLATLQKYHGVKNERPDDKQAAGELEDEVKVHYGLGVGTLGRWAEWVDSRKSQSTDKLCQPFELEAKLETKLNEITPHIIHIKKEENSLEEIGAKLEAVNTQISKIEEEIKTGKDDFSKLVSELALKAKKKEITELNTERNPFIVAIEGVKGAIATIQNDIRRFINDFDKLSFARKFARDVNDAIQMLENKKAALGPEAETEIERKNIGEIIEVFKERLHILNRQ